MKLVLSNLFKLGNIAVKVEANVYTVYTLP